MSDSIDAGHKIKAGNAAAIAAALWDSADFTNAAIYFERAIRETPSDLEALYGMGRLKVALNDLAPAIVFLEQAQALALTLAGGGRDELSLRVKRELAAAYYRLDRFDLAAALYDEIPTQQAFAAQLHAFGSTVPYQLTSPTEEISLPFLGTDPLPIVTLVLGGKEHAFVIDTGAAQLTLDTSFIRELGLTEYGKVEARLASGTQAPLVYTIVPEVRLGEAVLQHVPAEVMDIRRYAPQISGFIGTNFLQRFYVLFDVEGEVLRLRPRRYHTPFSHDNMLALPLWWMDTHLLFTPIRLNEYDTIAYLTTGMAGADFTVPDSTTRQAQLQGAGQTQGVSGGGSQDVDVVVAEQVRMGGWQRTHAEGLVGMFPSPLEWRYGFRVGCIASWSLLRNKRMVLDFEAMTLLLE